MSEGVYYDSCLDALECWDEDWVCCPVCGGFAILDDETGDLVYLHDMNIELIMH